MAAAVASLLVLTVFLSFGTPIPFCFACAMAIMHFFGDVSMAGVLMYGLQQIVSPILLSIPLFVFAGGLMAESGIAKQLIDFVNIFAGRVKGGLGVVSTVTCAILGAVTGSALTGVAAIAPIMVPRMVEEGYPRGYATAIVTISSVLGLLIPPSITMITYGWVTETSILACFIATFIPGLIVTFLFSVINMWSVRHWDLMLQPKATTAEKLSQAGKSFKRAFPALMMPVIILGGIYGGIMTPTEAAAVAVGYSMLVGFVIYKGLHTTSFYGAACTSATTVGSIMLMIMICISLGQTYVMVGVPQAITEAMLSISENKYVILILVNVLFLIMGMLVSDMVTTLLVVPLIFPLVTAIGVHPVHFAAIVGVNLAAGVVTPPYASVLYLGIRLGNATFQDTIRPLMVFLLAGYIPVLILTTFIPQLSLFLPGVFGLIR